MTDETKTNLPALQQNQPLGPFASPDEFAKYIQMARALSQSDIVPKSYRGEENLGNCLLALDMAGRLKANPLMVMQNLYLVEGRPSWSSKFLIATVNSSGRFSPLRFVESEDDKEKEISYEITNYTWSGGQRQRRVEQHERKFINRRCFAVATDLATGQELVGTEVDYEMAMREGWWDKRGSKWQTMPRHMLRYRAASYWVSQYAPETSMGIPTEEESRDVIDVTPVAEPDTPESRETVNALNSLARKNDDTPASEPEKPAEKPAEKEKGAWPIAVIVGDETTWQDSRGVLYNAEVHGSSGGTPSVTDDGIFRKRRNCDLAQHAAYEQAELDRIADKDMDRGMGLDDATDAQPTQPEQSAQPEPQKPSEEPVTLAQLTAGMNEAANGDELEALMDMSRSFTDPTDREIIGVCYQGNLSRLGLAL